MTYLVKVSIKGCPSIISETVEVLSKVVGKTSTCFAYIRLLSAGADNGINDIARHTGEAFSNSKSPLNGS